LALLELRVNLGGVVDMQTSALGKWEQHIHEKNIEMQRRETGANRFRTDVVNFSVPSKKSTMLRWSIRTPLGRPVDPDV
jgi:hypothetical protein